MKGCSADRHSADKDGLQVSYRSDIPGATNLHENAIQNRKCLFRRILVGNRPSRSPCRIPKLFLHRLAVDLDDDSIDSKWQVRPGNSNLVDEIDDSVDSQRNSYFGPRRKANLLQVI